MTNDNLQYEIFNKKTGAEYTDPNKENMSKTLVLKSLSESRGYHHIIAGTASFTIISLGAIIGGLYALTGKKSGIGEDFLASCLGVVMAIALAFLIYSICKLHNNYKIKSRIDKNLIVYIRDDITNVDKSKDASGYSEKVVVMSYDPRTLFHTTVDIKYDNSLNTPN